MRVVMIGTALRTRGGVSAVERGIMHLSIPGIEISHVATHADGPVPRLRTFATSIFLRRRKVISADLVHIHFASRGSFLRKSIWGKILRRHGVPYICHAHGAEFHIFFEQGSRRQKDRIAAFLRGSQGIIVLSESWRNFYAELVGPGGPPIWVLPNFAPPVSKGNPPVDRVRFLFTGRIGERKGAFDLIRAFTLLGKQVPNVQLDVVGDGEIDKARELAASSPAIRVHGWISLEEKNELLSNSHVFVLPSYNEGLPMSVLEGMSHGLAIIATPVGGIPELIQNGENGVLVPPGNQPALIAAMGSLATDPAGRDRLRTAAVATAEKHSLENYGRQLSTIYLQAAKK